MLVIKLRLKVLIMVGVGVYLPVILHDHVSLALTLDFIQVLYQLMHVVLLFLLKVIYHRFVASIPLGIQVTNEVGAFHILSVLLRSEHDSGHQQIQEKSIVLDAVFLLDFASIIAYIISASFAFA